MQQTNGERNGGMEIWTNPQENAFWKKEGYENEMEVVWSA